jgi:polysaccharide export outer membrane protein
MKQIKLLIRAVIGMALLVSSYQLTAESSYKINPGDILRIDVWNEESLAREVVVQPDGYISFPLVGEILVGGDTATNAQNQLAEALGKFLKDTPAVTVMVEQLLGNKIYVLGKVNRPGEFPINRPTDVMQALAMAGGLNTFAAENKINVLRRIQTGEQVAIPFAYSEVKEGEKLQSNILLQSGDVVVVR